MAIIKSGWVLQPQNNNHGVAAFAKLCLVANQLVVGPTHGRGGIIDILTTDVPDL